MRIQFKSIVLQLCLFALCCHNYSYAQTDDSNINSNPYQTIRNHLYYLQADSYDADQAALSLPPDVKKRKGMAIKLKQVLDGKGIYLDLNRIPSDNDYKDSTRMESIYILNKSEPKIYVEKVDSLWYYSRTTIEEIPELHRKMYPFGTDFISKLSGPFWQFKLLGIKLWKWLGLAIVTLLAFILFSIVTRISEFFITNFVKHKLEVTEEVKDSLHRLAKVLGFILAIRLMLYFLPMFQLAPKLNANIIKGLNVLSIFFLILALKFIIKTLFTYFETVTIKTENTLDDQLLPVLYKLSLIILWSMGIVYILDYLGVNITALLAGISIGGLALALAAQDTVKNFFGSIMIFLDKPFQIGDLIEFNNTTGTVEEVGVRSTRIRTANNSLIYAPNALLADTIINNLGLRVFRRYNTSLAVTYDTPAETIDAFVKNVREIINMHPKILKTNFEVHLNQFADSSLNILINLYFETQSWSEELSYRHELMIAILKMAESMGVRFAFPTQTIHVEELAEAGTSRTPKPKDLQSNAPDVDTTMQNIESYFAERQSKRQEVS